MAVGTIQKSVLADIANAIRARNGRADTYTPAEMASAVLALDGTSGGDPLQTAAPEGAGLISTGALRAIADAIRAQNGLSDTYTPAEMAPAILALTWDTGLKMRALLLADGTLELNCRETARSDIAGAEVVESWEIPQEGILDETGIPWRSRAGEVLRARIDADFADGGLENASYLFCSMSRLTEISGFEALAGATTFDRVLSGCRSLETVYASGWEPAGEQTGSLGLLGCYRLVGAQGYAPGYGTSIDGHLGFGEEGILTDSAADGRAWARCHLYADGELRVALDPEPEAGRELAASGRMCATARYRQSGCRAWADAAVDVARVSFAEDLAGLPFANLSYWFYGESTLAEVDGLANLPLREARFAFANCGALAALDLRGLPTGGLADLSSCFSSCTALATILADADWALPEGCRGSSCFYRCDSLVGGAGTAWSNLRTGIEYMRIDDPPDAPGYLTAG